MKTQQTIIGKNIRTLRCQRNMSQERLALEAEISLSNLRLIEQGMANPTILTLLRIANSLHVTINDILYQNPNEVKEVQKLIALMHKLLPEKEDVIMEMIHTIIKILTPIDD